MDAKRSSSVDDSPDSRPTNEPSPLQTHTATDMSGGPIRPISNDGLNLSSTSRKSTSDGNSDVFLPAYGVVMSSSELLSTSSVSSSSPSSSKAYQMKDLNTPTNISDTGDTKSKTSDQTSSSASVNDQSTPDSVPHELEPEYNTQTDTDTDNPPPPYTLPWRERRLAQRPTFLNNRGHNGTHGEIEVPLMMRGPPRGSGGGLDWSGPYIL